MKMGYYCQILSTALLSYLCIVLGTISAWPSSTVFIFTSNDTTLNRPMSQTEVSFFGSLQSGGAVIGTAITGLFLDKLGRKRTTVLSALAFVVAWTMIAVSQQVEIILTAIFISGLGSAVFMVVVVYVSEICEDFIRGMMTACPIMFSGTGLMISYLLGGVLTYNTMVYVYLTMAIAGVVAVSVLKESPTSLMAKGFEHEAAKSIAFYRMKNKSSKEVLEEISKIRRILSREVEETVNLTTKETGDQMKQREKLSFRYYFKKIVVTRKQMTVCLFLVSSYVLQGFPIVQVYLEPLFKEVVPSDVMSANLCSILTAILSVLSGIVSAYLTDALGRRPLIILSSAVTGVLCIIIGTQTQLQWGPKWLSAVVTYLYIIFYTFGAGTIPFVINAEVFLPEVKSMMSTLVMEWSWLCNFMMLYIFPPALSSLGVSSIFYFFAAMSFATSVFCARFLPETRGLSIDAIQKLFNKP